MRTILSIFPTPVYLVKLNREFSPQEKKFVEEEAEDLVQNIGNMIGKRNDVLDFWEMRGLRSFVEKHLNAFLDEVYAPDPPLDLYITQSWLNYTYPGQSHHAHMHDNSFISGVLYINADRDTDTLVFHSGRPQAIRLTTSSWNTFNTETWTIPVGSGDLMLFPSKMTHHVSSTPVDRNMTRVSLAFNTFLRGEIGDPSQRIHLVLK